MVAFIEIDGKPTGAFHKQRLRRDGRIISYRLGSAFPSNPAPAQGTNPPILQRAIDFEQDEGEEERQLLRRRRLQSLKRNHTVAPKFTDKGIPSSLLDDQIGGFREDPFNMYPIDCQPEVRVAIDYFTQVYAPFAIRKTLVKTYFQTLLHDAMFFEQVVAFSLAAQDLRRAKDGHMTKLSRQVIHHSNNAITHLRSRLLSTAYGASDVVLLTMMQQAAIQHMIGNHEIFGVHARAIELIVDQRGGLENLGWDGYVAARVRQVISAWNILQKPEARRYCGTIKGLSSGAFTYPQHPFTPELCRKIAKYPSGISELAMQKELSLQFIEYLDLTISWVKDENGQRKPTTTTAYEILGMPKLTTTERLLGVAVQAYSNYVERIEYPGSNVRKSVTERAVQDSVEILSSDNAVGRCDPDLLLWVRLMLQATNGRGMDFSFLKSQSARATGDGSERKEELGRRFLPIPCPTLIELVN